MWMSHTSNSLFFIRIISHHYPIFITSWYLNKKPLYFSVVDLCKWKQLSWQCRSNLIWKKWLKNGFHLMSLRFYNFHNFKTWNSSYMQLRGIYLILFILIHSLNHPYYGCIYLERNINPSLPIFILSFSVVNGQVLLLDKWLIFTTVSAINMY